MADPSLLLILLLLAVAVGDRPAASSCCCASPNGRLELALREEQRDGRGELRRAARQPVAAAGAADRRLRRAPHRAERTHRPAPGRAARGADRRRAQGAQRKRASRSSVSPTALEPRLNELTQRNEAAHRRDARHAGSAAAANCRPTTPPSSNRCAPPSTRSCRRRWKRAWPKASFKLVIRACWSRCTRAWARCNKLAAGVGDLKRVLTNVKIARHVRRSAAGRACSNRC